jgi:hypothetical protein
MSVQRSRAAWAQILGDYAIAQPFPQIGREVYTPRDDERDGPVARRFEGVILPKKAFFILEAKGWTRAGGPFEAPEMKRELDDGEHTATLAMRDEDGALRAREVRVDVRRLGDLEPIAFSEMVRDIERARL